MRHSTPVRATILLAVIISVCACQRKKSVSSLPIKQYELHGRVVRLNPQTHAAVINGQEIEGWMSAMTMEYPVKADNDYQSLSPGEHIRATVFVQGMDFWIAGIHREAVLNPAGEVPAAK